MAHTTNELISGSYYASGVVSREFETVSGGQIADGLQWLNDILAEKNVDQGMIPYESTYNFNAQAGVEKYFIPDLNQIDTLVFYLGSVRYSMVYTKRNQYFGSARVENVQSLPNQWYFERQVGGGNLYIYFKPDQGYPIEIHGSFNINSVALGQDLSTNESTANLGIPTFYFNDFVNNQYVASIAPGQFVVNGVDLNGSYPTIGALVNYINTGVIPNVLARIQVNDLVIYSDTNTPVIITMDSVGYPPNGTRFIQQVLFSSTLNLTNTAYANINDGVGATLVSTVNGFLFLDSIAVPVNSIVLIKDQINSFENGIYVVTDTGSLITPWKLTRTTNYDQPREISTGDIFTIDGGATLSGFAVVQTSTVNSVGISPILFSSFTAVTFANFSTIGLLNKQVFIPRGFDQFYTSYLRYALADRICAEYNYDTPMNVVKQLSKYEAMINNKSRLIDLKMEKASTLQKRVSLDWQQINIGRGYTPS